MIKENIFIDKKNNDIFSKYKNIKIEKMYLTISYIDKNLLKILQYICEERNINKLVKHHTSLILFMKKEEQNIILKIDKLLSGVTLREVNSLNNIIYLKSVKLSKKRILFSEFLDNYIKEKGTNSLNSYDCINNNCFTFINDIIKFNNLSIPKNNLIETLYKRYLNIKLDKNKRRFGLSVNTIIKIINFILRYKVMRILLMFIAHFVS
jgi:hypothetical protein